MSGEKLKNHIQRTVERAIGPDFTFSILRKIYVRRYIRAGVVFVHVPRAAGSSVARAVIGKRAGHLTVQEIKGEIGADRYRNLFSFAVTRHPLDRLLSAYKFARRGGGHDGAIAFSAVYRSDLFSSFNKFVLEWLIHQNVDELDYVFRSQWHFINDAGEIGVDYLGDVRNMMTVQRVVSSALGREIRIGVSNKSYEGYEDVEVYDEDVRNAIYKLYKKDFLMLGYEI